MPRHVVDPPRREPIAWAHCAYCNESYPAELDHACEDPLGPARGIALCVLGGGVCWLVLVLAGVTLWPLA